MGLRQKSLPVMGLRLKLRRYFKDLFCFFEVSQRDYEKAEPATPAVVVRPLPRENWESFDIRAAQTLQRHGIPHGVAVRTKSEARAGVKGVFFM